MTIIYSNSWHKKWCFYGHGTGAWTTVKFSTQARTITLTGLTTGTVYQVRARALGGSTGQSDWSMPGSKIAV